MKAHVLAMAGKAVLGITLVGIVGALAIFTIVPRALDGAALTVLTGSMTPAIPVGSVVLVRPTDPATLEVGDVVTYQRAPGEAHFITHRIVEIHDETNPVTLTTKGDANRGEDIDPIAVTSVRGKVLFHVPHLGTVQNALSTGGTGLLIAIVGLTGYALTQVVSAIRGRRELDIETLAPSGARNV